MALLLVGGRETLVDMRRGREPVSEIMGEMTVEKTRLGDKSWREKPDWLYSRADFLARVGIEEGFQADIERDAVAGGMAVRDWIADARRATMQMEEELAAQAEGRDFAGAALSADVALCTLESAMGCLRRMRGDCERVVALESEESLKSLRGDYTYR